MPKNKISPSIDALAAGVLSCEGRTQMEIASTLGVTQTAVSRMLKMVRGEYFEIKRVFNWDLLTEKQLLAVKERKSRREVSQALGAFAESAGSFAPSVHIVEVEDEKLLGIQFEMFAEQAAPVLGAILEDVQGRVGVAWGSTIWHTVQSLREKLPQRPIRERTPIQFIPLCGDPLVDSEQYVDRTSSRIVSDLSKMVNGSEPTPIWLGVVPAFIPRSLRPNEIKVVDKLIDLVPQYGRIFGSRVPKGRRPIPLAEDLHMIITAAGSSERPLGFGKNPLMGLSELESNTLAQNIYGDIGGVLLPRGRDMETKHNRAKAPHKLVQELASRWTGLRLEHLRKCASEAFSEQKASRPGVVLLSFGKSHAQVVLEAVRLGLVNQLVIGSDLEAEILKRLGR